VVGAAQGLAVGQLSKPADMLGLSRRLVTSRGRLPENGSPSERGPVARLTEFPRRIVTGTGTPLFF